MRTYRITYTLFNNTCSRMFTETIQVGHDSDETELGYSEAYEWCKARGGDLFTYQEVK